MRVILTNYLCTSDEGYRCQKYTARLALYWRPVQPEIGTVLVGVIQPLF